MKRIFVLGLLTLLFACNNPEKKKTVVTKQVKHDPVLKKTIDGVIYTDTIKVSGRRMVFFMPTEQEFDTMLKNKGGDLNEVVGDYTEYMGRMIDSLKKSNQLQTTVTNKHIITVQMANGHQVSFNRMKGGDNFVGVILCDDVKQPEISWGVATDTDYWIAIKAYYGK